MILWTGLWLNSIQILISTWLCIGYTEMHCRGLHHQYHNTWLNYLVGKNYWGQNCLVVGQLHCIRVYRRNWNHGFQRGIFWRYCTKCTKCTKNYSETMSVGFTKLPKESVEKKKKRILALNHKWWFILCFFGKIMKVLGRHTWSRPNIMDMWTVLLHRIHVQKGILCLGFILCKHHLKIFNNSIFEFL